MATLVAVFGGLIALVGATGAASPATLMRFVTSVWQSQRAIYIAVGFRLTLGVVLIAAASSCRFPEVVRVLGVLTVVSAILIPFIGFERLRAAVDWWAARSPVFLRAWALVATALGAFLIYAAI